MPCGWEGNRRSGELHWPCVRDFSSLSTIRAYGLRKGDEHPAYTPHGVMAHFLLFASALYAIVLFACLSVTSRSSNKIDKPTHTRVQPFSILTLNGAVGLATFTK